MKRKALISATAVLLVAIMCLATASYAWFTEGSASKVATFNVGVTIGDSGLLIAPANVKDGSFKCASFTKNALYDLGENPQNTTLANYGYVTTVLDPVSTNAVYNDSGKINFFEAPSGTFDGTNWTASAYDLDTNDGVIYFGFYVKSATTGNYSAKFDTSKILGHTQAQNTVRIAYAVEDTTVAADGTAVAVVPEALTICQFSDADADYDPIASIGTGDNAVNTVTKNASGQFVPATGSAVTVDDEVDTDTAFANIPLEFKTANTAKLVVVALWLEGQDTNATGAIDISGQDLVITVA